MTVIARISSLCIRNECCFRFILSVASVYPRSFASLKACLHRPFYHGTLYSPPTGCLVKGREGSIQGLVVFAPCMLLGRLDCGADGRTIWRASSFYSSLFSSRSISLLLSSSFYPSFNPTTYQQNIHIPIPWIVFRSCPLPILLLFDVVTLCSQGFLTSACILNP